VQSLGLKTLYQLNMAYHTSFLEKPAHSGEPSFETTLNQVNYYTSHTILPVRCQVKSMITGERAGMVEEKMDGMLYNYESR